MQVHVGAGLPGCSNALLSISRAPYSMCSPPLCCPGSELQCSSCSQGDFSAGTGAGRCHALHSRGLCSLDTSLTAGFLAEHRPRRSPGKCPTAMLSLRGPLWPCVLVTCSLWPCVFAQKSSLQRKAATITIPYPGAFHASSDSSEGAIKDLNEKAVQEDKNAVIGVSFLFVETGSGLELKTILLPQPPMG